MRCATQIGNREMKRVSCLMHSSMRRCGRHFQRATLRRSYEGLVRDARAVRNREGRSVVVFRHDEQGYSVA